MRENIWGILGVMVAAIGLVSAGSATYLSLYAFPNVKGIVLEQTAENLKEKVDDIKRIIDDQSQVIQNLRDEAREQRLKSEELNRNVKRFLERQRRKDNAERDQ